MAEEEYRCEECGKIFSSTETLDKHSRVEHGFSARYIQLKEFEIPEISFNRDLFIGFAAGLLLTVALLSGYYMFQQTNQGDKVQITVVTCDNCSYDEFRETANSLFDTEYREVNYTSEEGKKLIEKYNLYYVPGFIFEKKVEDAENFTRVKSTLVEFEDAYVLPDRGVEAAQRVSEGFTLHRHR